MKRTIKLKYFHSCLTACLNALYKVTNMRDMYDSGDSFNGYLLQLLEAQRCRYNPPQAPDTPDWLYQCCLACIHNQPFRRPTTSQLMDCLNDRYSNIMYFPYHVPHGMGRPCNSRLRGSALDYILTNRASGRSCARGMIRYKIHPIRPGSPQHSIALQCRIVA